MGMQNKHLPIQLPTRVEYCPEVIAAITLCLESGYGVGK